MSSEDPLDFAYTAIARVADIASLLGVQHKRPICGRLGAELLLVADYLDTADHDQEERLRLRISKLLKDVETICSETWRTELSPNKSNHTLLKAIARAEPNSLQYMRAQTDIQQGIINITSTGGSDAEKAIAHLQRFMKKHGDTRRAEGGEDVPKSLPAEYINENKALVNILQEQMCCTCNITTTQQVHRRHLAKLLLRPPSQITKEQGQARFDMLFSSAPVSDESQFGYWQDVELIVSQVKKKSKKRVTFSNHNTVVPQPAPSSHLVQVDRGQFCKLLRLEADSRVCLVVQDGKLQQSGFKPIEQIVEHVPGISLGNILRMYHLTAKMKVSLAYILAHAVWQYYDSDWMKTQWTGDSIQFMKERPSHNMIGGQSSLFAWKPYLSVHFIQKDQLPNESSITDGRIHPFPKIQALGIMLVEIGIGSPLYRNSNEHPSQSQAAKANKDLLLAIQYAQDEKLWEDCDYPSYLSSVKSCLDPGIFLGHSEDAESLRERRDTLYNKVVFPLEELLRGTQWINHLTEIGPLSHPAKRLFNQTVSEQAYTENTTTESSSARRKVKKVLTRSQKDAKLWLSRIQRLNEELSDSSIVAVTSSTPVRIAVLDTGCDTNALFFFDPANSRRLKEWKDWTNEPGEWEDSHGHGTHLTSLLMKIAPEAHVYVARVTKSPDELFNSSENVAKAISWASKEWKADIISMSFGFADEQLCISRAIRGVMHDRDDSVLLFAAASNYGANEKEMFPARHDSVISIRGTNANGDFEDFNPPRSQNEERVIGTLGLDVPSAWLSDYDEEKYQSGTSVATAVAAGIAGLLLGYISSKSEKSSFSELNKKLRTRQGMRSVFMELASRTQKEHYLYLTPWKLMGKSEEVRWATFVAALDEV
ncbi:hypothetical protein TARUN_8912 [Trichoderma arundinaceum]|uniref:Uncharacterized protein n=1 Tax=Trichoderma arundinaceum TaxID=490622 RepID=A0A395NB69_TRIAR|nr:hypothetical protein TARUN_8912 [Trichoderma arundinaceum]